MSSNNIYKLRLTELEAYQIALNQIQQLKEEKDRLAHALAGAWEANSKHRAEIEHLKAENELMRNHIESAETEFYVQLGALRVSLEQVDKDRDILHAEIERLKAELDGVRDMLLDVANSGIEIDLKKYVTVQINRTMWDKIQEWAKDKEPT